jgi:hypothetical protein
MWVRAGPISKLWRILDVKGDSGLMSDSELRGGSLHPCRLRTDHLVPVSKFDYVLTHTGFMGSHKLTSFYGHWVVMYTGIVYGPPTDVHLGKVGPGPALWSLSWTVTTCGILEASHVMLSGCYLERCKLTRVSMKPSDMGDTCLLQSFHNSAIFTYVHMRFMFMFNYDYLVVENDDNKTYWLSYLAWLA